MVHMKTHGAILLCKVTTATGNRSNGSQLKQFKLLKMRAERERDEQVPSKWIQSFRCLALLSVISVFTEIYAQIKITLLTGLPIRLFPFLRFPVFCGFCR